MKCHKCKGTGIEPHDPKSACGDCGGKGHVKKPKPLARCLSCGCPLFVTSGYNGTGMCGPCATGDPATHDKVGISW